MGSAPFSARIFSGEGSAFTHLHARRLRIRTPHDEIFQQGADRLRLAGLRSREGCARRGAGLHKGFECPARRRVASGPEGADVTRRGAEGLSAEHGNYSFRNSKSATKAATARVRAGIRDGMETAR